MSNRKLALLTIWLSVPPALSTAVVFLHRLFFHDDPSFLERAMTLNFISGICMTPLAVFGAALSVKVLRHMLREPEIAIAATEPPMPLPARFLEQDRRLERRETLKGDLLKLNGEIETFAAGLTLDERKAWYSRPGPYR